MNHSAEDRFPYRYFIYFLSVSLFIAVIGYLFYLDRKKNIEEELYRHVVAIKEIKLQQIGREQLQRKSLLQSFFLLPSISEDVLKLTQDKRNADVLESISKWSRELIENYEFVSVNIFNKNAEIIYSTDKSESISRSFLKHELNIILQNDSSALTNLYLGNSKNLLQAIITPIKRTGLTIGFIWTEVPFFEYLYPIISYTKQESEEVEFILLKNKSDIGFILKDVRENNEVILRTLPLSRQSRIALEKYVAEKGFNRDIENESEKIIASVNNLPGTDWILIARINQDKLTESIRNTALLVFIISILLIGLSASITYAIWKQSRIHFLTRTLNLRREKEAISERYTSLTRYANDMIFSLDKNGQILEANQKAFDTYGYRKDELLNMNLLDLGMDRKKDLGIIFSSINTKEGALFETSHKRKNGTVFPVEISAKLIRQGDEEILLAIIRDNTDRKRLELDLILAKDKAEEMDRLKTIFLSNMSHELNTPMSGIIGFSELLLTELEDGHHKDMAAFIHKSSRRLNDTLTSLLDISNLQSKKIAVKLTAVELNSLLQESVLNFQEPAISKGLIINFTRSVEKILVKAEYSILTKIFNNLIDNAVKYTRRGEINIHSGISNQNAVIEIKDTGIGISEEHLEVIFEPFRQASEGLTRKFEGSGLGLSITKKFIDIMRGSISISSKPDEGTALTVKLPLYNE